MNIPYFQVDAFTRVPFKGNPAGICLLQNMPEDTLLTAIAAENNLSETAFLLPEGAGYRLRWFSPLVEIPLCGHATLASAHILWENGLAPVGEPISFYTLSGTLTAYQEDGWIVLDFPARSHEPATLPDDLMPLFTEAVQVTYSVDRYIVELPSGDAVTAFVPDTAVLRPYRCIITGKADTDSPYDFISRFFAGPIGVDEDPVTGSAHCSLAPYWAERLHKHEFFAWQASKRGGELKVALRGDRVLLKGEAISVMKGQFSI